jgi:hypothetical protein
VRKVAKILALFERQEMNKRKDNVSKEKLLVVLEFANQAQKIIVNLGLTVNW